MFSRLTYFCIVILFFLTSPLSAHEGLHRPPHATENKQADASNEETRIFKQINENYEKDVKPIFQSKCMNCHSTQTNYPTYYNWPFAKKIIDDDITESKKHLDMTNGFPFAGHGTPAEDLEAIKKVSAEGTMPPLRYRVLNWNSALTESERITIVKWLNESIELLK